MENISLRILCLEDDPHDAEIIKELLIDANFSVNIDHVANKKDFIKALNNDYDIILSDFKLPSFDAFEALSLSINICPNTPFICVSGSIGEETAIELLKQGAVDYILKDRLVRLPFAIKRALEESKEKTTRRLAEEELRKSEKRFQTLAEISPVGIFQTDASGYTTYVNPRWCQISGMDCKEALGYGWQKAVHPDDIDKLSFGWQEATEKQISSMAEYRFLRSDGSISWVMGQATPEINNENQIVGYVGTITDITTLKQTEKELRTAKEKAEEMNRLKSSFLANMSHELRTPLVGILGFSEVLKDELSDEDYKNYAKLINESGSRLKETLNQILDLSKIESGTIELNPEKIEITGHINNLAKGFIKAAEDKLIKLNIIPAKELIYVNMDKVLLNSIINNLMNNAVKYTLKGCITVKIDKRNYGKKEEVEISIADSGIGIEEKNLSIIFEPFRQISEGWERNFEGTGLGLTIVKDYVERMNGSISVESELGIGSVFTVRFPITKEESVENIDITNRIKAAKDRMQKIKDALEQDKYYKPLILCVEDDEVTQSVIKTIVFQSYQIEFADNSYQAMELVNEKNYDIILMDINLGGGINGLEVAKAINNIDRFKSTPIIALTAYAMVGDKEKMLNGGCTHYLSKPFSKNDLLSLLKEVHIDFSER